MEIRTAIYARYSSDAQRAASIRDQIRNVEDYCRRMSWPAPIVFKDEAVSGARLDRAGYRAMLQAASAGHFNVLLVDDYSRLTRDIAESARLVQELAYYEVRLIGVTDGVDTSREGSILDTGIRGVLNHVYLVDLAKKTHRGLTGQALDGYNTGGLPYGYSSVAATDGKRRVVNAEQAEWVRWIFERYASGDSSRTIAAELNRLVVPSPRKNGKWAPNAIYPDAKGVGILGNPIYVGKPIWNRTKWVKDPATGRRRRRARPENEWITVASPDLQIVSDELWWAVEKRIHAVRARTKTQRTANGGKGSGGRGPRYLFSGLMRCGSCGGAYIVVDRYRYGCAMHRDRGRAACSNALKVPRERVEKLLLQGIKQDLLSDEAFKVFEDGVRRLLAEGQPEARDFERDIARASREVENIMNAIRQGVVTPTTLTALRDAEAKVNAAKARQQEAERMEPVEMIPRAREIHHEMVSKLEQIDDVAAAREAIRAIVGEIRLVPDGDELIAEMTNAGLAGVCELTLVAGAGFEPTTFGL
ncbi:recombinase family protein [Thiomonas intermedia]|uniref:recombinase family protein n=1 Tax=Thiomonas intermedia TaxID=926 RepID=UPI0009A53022|nr:recombinase family protein [Thiomonas intermedia]